MARLTVLAALLPLVLHATATAPTHQPQHDPVCLQIQKVISRASAVYFPGDERYASGIAHWASSSSENSTCVVEPGSSKDVAAVLRVVGQHKTPFAVKGGGHASNVGFSSTTGVQIAMSRFSDVKYNAHSQTAEIGTGLIWDDVYAALEAHNVSVVGGRVSGVGVAGFTLGGGYSWLTNQHGLTVDTVVAYELVKPNGQVEVVNKATDPALFFALKGGFNNFGIVTKFTLKTFPMTGVWGGFQFVAGSDIAQNTAAVADFCANVKDPKANIISNFGFVSGQPAMTQILFYDGPNPPAGIFDKLLAVPTVIADVSSRNMTSFMKSVPDNAGLRGAFHTVPILKFTPSLLNVIANESMFWGSQLASKGAGLISYAIEPFQPDIYKHNPDKTAYPPVRDVGYLPLNLYFAWVPAEFDDDFHAAMVASGDVIRKAALAEGQDITNGPLYPNYALPETPLSAMYGKNVAELHRIKKTVDPKNVMGLAGGFKF
ncbi:FAD-binding domain-containing protein [Agrocybe pediades]|nr:FAD-binding domain-containing protein [Agrocybe pediades]